MMDDSPNDLINDEKAENEDILYSNTPLFLYTGTSVTSSSMNIAAVSIIELDNLVSITAPTGSTQLLPIAYIEPNAVLSNPWIDPKRNYLETDEQQSLLVEDKEITRRIVPDFDQKGESISGPAGYIPYVETPIIAEQRKGPLRDGDSSKSGKDIDVFDENNAGKANYDSSIDSLGYYDDHHRSRIEEESKNRDRKDGGNNYDDQGYHRTNIHHK